jgi:hypothetical protein
MRMQSLVKIISGNPHYNSRVKQDLREIRAENRYIFIFREIRADTRYVFIFERDQCGDQIARVQYRHLYL